ncbi:hypothetical protein KJ786_02735 [Patescibacteria group bacterium]|nr:hypothetical protein [Patescibacteria group bacterium]
MTTHALVQTLSLQKASSRPMARLAKMATIRLPKINWKALLLFGFCGVLFFSVLYVFQINEMIRGGYVIKSYQAQVDNLIQGNKNLEIRLAQISYLENIQSKAAELNFTQVKRIGYIQILDSSLAQR